MSLFNHNPSGFATITGLTTPKIYKTTLSCFLLLITLVTTINAQETDALLEKGMVKANLFFTPSINYEYNVYDNFTLKAEAGITPTYFDIFGSKKVAFFQKYEAQGKYYYNLKKRVSKGKSVSGNSGNFVAAVYNYQNKEALFSEVSRSTDFSTLGGVWGFQRSYNSGLSLLFEIGFGYDFAYRSNGRDTNGRPFPLIGFELGWVIFKHN